MKNLPFVITLAASLCIVSGCAVAKGLVRDACHAVEAALDVPLGVATNSVETVKAISK